METKNGQFVWYELMTSDVKGAIAFYTDVVGWKTQVFEGSDQGGKEPYMMWVSGQGPMGGVITLPEQAKAMGAPPHWMAHIQAANVDESVARLEKLGGRVYVPPMDIPKVGRFSVVADPHGAVFSIFKPEDPMTEHDVSKAGEMSWNELIAGNNEEAFRFYTELFGWERVSEYDMGPMGKYILFGKDGKTYGGIMTKPKDAPIPPTWMYYAHVDDLDSAFARAKEKGAKVLVEPMSVPDGSRIAQLIDPQGAGFALHAAGNAKAS